MRSLLLSFVILFSTTSHAQQWNWAVSAGGGGNTDFCFGIATDSQGNAYWVGSVSGTADFGCGTLSPGSTIAGFVAKVGPNGACQWVRGITTGFYDAWVYGIAIDADDRIYITGSCQGNTDFGDGIILSGSGSSDDWFTARYDTSGTCIWAKRITNTSSTSEGHGIAVDAQGFVYATGFAGGSSYTFDPITVTPGSFTRQAVIVKYDSTGTALWAKATTGISGSKSARSISVVNDRLFITGQNYYSISSFDGIPIATSDAWAEVYVLACDLDGNGLWARSYGGGDHEGYSVAADTLGNLFVVGRMWGNLNLPDDTLASVSSNDDILLMGFDQDGNYRWAKSTGSTQRDLAWGVTADGMGNAYVAAQFNNTIDFFGTPVTALGSEDALIAKVDADGDVVWTSRPSGAQRDIPLCIHRQAVAPHKMYFGGYYWGVITYGSSTIDDVANGDAMLVSGMDTTFDVSALATATCPGTCDGTAIAFSGGDGPFTFVWNTGETTQEITGLCPGMYIVEVTDMNGQVNADTVYVNEVLDPGYTVQQNGNVLFINGGNGYAWYADGLPIAGADSSSIQAGASGNYYALVTAAGGCMFSSDTLDYISVGLAIDQHGTEMVVFPSPAGDRITVRTSQPISAAFAVNVIGAAIPLRMDAPGQFNVRELAPGTYALRVRSQSGQWSVRTFMKE